MVTMIVALVCNLFTLHTERIEIPTTVLKKSECQESGVRILVDWSLKHQSWDVQSWKCEEDPTKENS